jgi:hypothetical protein
MKSRHDSTQARKQGARGGGAARRFIARLERLPEKLAGGRRSERVYG